MTALRIGFVGLGNMGGPMACRLAGAGHAVQAYDCDPRARDRLAGVPGLRLTATLGDVAGQADAVILMLPDSDVVEQVLLAEKLLDRIAPPTLLADMSSAEPARTGALAREAARRGVTMVDAPVSGGVTGARHGSLTIMTGGPAAALERLGPAFAVLAARVVHAGELPGAGHAVKALNNLMSAAHLLISSEAILAGQAFGLDPAVILEIVNTSSGRSGSTQTKWPDFILPGRFDSGFGLRLMLKDMRTARRLEHSAGLPAPLSQAAVEAWAEAAAVLPPDADHTEIARWLLRGSPDGPAAGNR